jgi:REP-associated tyrosine transposase
MRSGPTDSPRRRSLRLRSHDYASPRAYFVTICIAGRARICAHFSPTGELRLSVLGQAIHTEWLRTALLRPSVYLDAFIVMPDHVHGVMRLDRSDVPERASVSLGAVIGCFKASCTRRVNAIRGTPGAVLWQRGFYERVIRDEDHLKRVRRYIEENPRRWFDREAGCAGR